MKEFNILLIKALCGNGFSCKGIKHLGNAFRLSNVKEYKSGNISIHKLRGR